jgi:hypothetical protein
MGENRVEKPTAIDFKTFFTVAIADFVATIEE